MKIKWKWNWGWGIFISIILFMGLTLTRVLVFMNEDVDLVTDHYYDKEMKYQQQIDKEKRTAELNENININYSGNFLTLTFPKDGKATGDLYFYRPSNLHKDFQVPINLDNSFSQLLDVSKLDKGLWKLQINWSVNKNDYYTEKTLMLN
jgi:hypothetical protein